MIQYTVTEEVLTDQDAGTYTTYGIQADQVEGERRQCAAKISDICLTRKRVEDLVETCNRLQLDVMHLCDVVDDFILNLDI